MSQHIWRFFTDEKLRDRTTVTLSEDERHLALHVLRLSIGDCVEITDGLGGFAKAKISHLDKKKFSCEIIESKNVSAPKHRVEVIVAMPKPATLDDVVARCTELGASCFHIFSADRSPTRAEPRVEKLQKQALAALRINKQLWLPEFFFYKKLDELMASGVLKGALLCDEDPIHSLGKNSHPHLLKHLINLETKPQCVRFIIGPEASFSEAERHALNSTPDIQPVSLGDAILTVPAACASAVTLVSSYFAS